MTQSYLRITNKGEVPAEAFTLVGASTKRNDSSKIGMFGSGNKYALAFLLRNNYHVRIFSGTKEIPIEVFEVSFGGEYIGVIHIDGKPTSITTQMGPDWTLWQSIREFYSNAMDEGEMFFKKEDTHPHGEMGVTSIFISIDNALDNFLLNMDKYFCENVPFVSKTATGEILRKNGEKLNLFRKGIRCYDSDDNSIFDYNLNEVPINESRVISSSSHAYENIWKLILECREPVVINDFLNGIYDPNLSEHNDYLDYWSAYGSSQFSEQWKEIIHKWYFAPSLFGGYVEDLIKDKTKLVPTKLYDRIIKEFGKERDALNSGGSGIVKYKEFKPNEFHTDSIKKVMDFFKEVGYEIDYPIVTAKFMIAHNETQDVFGMAQDGKIIISDAAFVKGLHFLATTVYEEHIHLKYRCQDKTRNMQNVLIDETINYMKRSNSINL